MFFYNLLLEMPSHLNANHLSKSKFIIQPATSTNNIEKELLEIAENAANKRSLAWSLARLQALEKKLTKP